MHSKPLPAPTLARHAARRTTISVERLIDAPFGFVLDRTRSGFRFFGPAATNVRVRLRDLGIPIDGSLTRPVTTKLSVRPDSTEPGRAHDEVVFDWNANAAWLPQFQAVVRFRITYDKTMLSLEGSYEPPFGRFGRAFDGVAGRRIAERSIDNLMARLGTSLETEWTEKRLAMQQEHLVRDSFRGEAR